MKTKFILILLIVLPIVNAGLEVEDIKGYINNERASDIDEDGGDFDVKKEDNIELTVRLENTENTTTQARLKGTLENIDDGDDIVKEQGWYDIGADDDKSKHYHSQYRMMPIPMIMIWSWRYFISIVMGLRGKWIQ